MFIFIKPEIGIFVKRKMNTVHLFLTAAPCADRIRIETCQDRELGMSAKPGSGICAAKAVRTPKQGRSKDKRTRIVEAAYALFDKHGYGPVTMRMIAEAASVSLGTPYSYFRDKKDIFKEALVLYGEELRGVFLHEMETVFSGSDSIEEAIYALILVLKRMMERHRMLQRETIVLSLLDDEIRQFFAAGEGASAGGLIDRFFDRFEEQLEIRDPGIAKFLIHKGIDQIIEYLVFNPVDVDEERVLRELARMYAGYLTTP
jgi:AcrR family transcriptional regulator